MGCNIRSENIKATFFIIGKNAEKYPQLAKMILADGHEIANHSYSHTKYSSVSDIKNANRAIKNLLDVTPKLFRPPWGKVKLSYLWYALSRNMKILLWSFDSLDCRLKTAEELIDHIRRSKISKGEIMLFHEDYQHTKDALPDIICDLKRRGFKFNTVSELLECKV